MTRMMRDASNMMRDASNMMRDASNSVHQIEATARGELAAPAAASVQKMLAPSQ